MAQIPMSSLDKFKNDVKHFLLSRANIRRVHIVGCPRSGTTMLQYSFIAFENAILSCGERRLWGHPSLTEALSTMRQHRPKRAKCYYITKRGAQWWQLKNIKRLAYFVRRYNIFLINIVRDPRDVLTSYHAGSGKKYYVDPSTWLDNIAATNLLMDYLRGYPDAVTIRYEDVVNDPRSLQQTLEGALALKVRPNVESWSQLKDNLACTARRLNGDAHVAMHQLRNFDIYSVGKWRKNGEDANYIQTLLSEPAYHDQISGFMARYDYK